MITVNNLIKKFDESIILNNINLSVKKNSTTVIIGPSGCGKSVLLKVLAGLIPYESGNISIQSNNIGMLFQKNALFDSLTVEENLLFPIQEKKGSIDSKDKQKAKHFLEEVGLDGCQNLYPDELSGGMQKRLGIARSLIINPEVILYDEPTAGLDPITSRKIADMILTLKKEVQGTVVMVTNDMQRAFQIGDEIYLLANGELKKGGTPEQVQSSQDPALKQFIYGLQNGPLTQEQV